MQRDPGKNQITFCRLLMKRTSHRRRRPQIFRQRLGHVPQGISGTAGHNEIAFRQQRTRFVPVRDVAEGVNSNQEEKPVRLPESFFQASNRINRIIHATRRSRSSRRLQQRRHESLFVLRGQRHHGITMDERAERLLLFVRRNICRHKQHLPQRVATGGRHGQCQVSAMDRVEAAAEKPDIHPVFPARFSCPIYPAPPG